MVNTLQENGTINVRHQLSANQSSPIPHFTPFFAQSI